MVVSGLMTFTSRLIRSFNCCVFILGAFLGCGRRVLSLGMVAQFFNARPLGEVIAAGHLVALFQAVADDAHAAMRASGRELMDRAFEAVERIGRVRP